MSTQSPSPFPTDGARKVTECKQIALVAKQLRSIVWRTASLILGITLLGACAAEDANWDVSYGAINHTDKSIVSIIINGEGGILHAPKHGEGGGLCCVRVPKKWTPDLRATIKWQEDGSYLLDEKGNVIFRDGKEVYVPSPWKTQTVPIPRYEREGYFYVFFFPNEVVKAAVASSPEYSEWEKWTPEDRTFRQMEEQQ